MQGNTTPSTAWKERVAPDEQARFARYAEQMKAIQLVKGKGRLLRTAHAKGTAGLEAAFTVLPNLPHYARVGLFAVAATHRAHARFSNASATAQSDRKPDVRGMALKIVGVDDFGSPTQDFTMNRGASIPFRNTDEFVRFVRIAQRPLFLLPLLFIHFGLMRAFQILGRLIKSLREPALPLSHTAFHSELPIKFGRYAVRYALMPRSTGSPAMDTSSPRFLGEHLAAQLRKGPVHYDFRIQFFVDESLTPIEDGSAEWRESDAPFVTVARVTLPQQDIESPRGKRVSEFVERLSFSPWHTSDAFRPLGELMRARREIYRLSSAIRDGQGEPDGSEQFD